MDKKVIIIGGGVAGLQTAVSLSRQGIRSVIIEKDTRLGGKLAGWHKLFPTFTPAGEVLEKLTREVIGSELIDIQLGSEAETIDDRSVKLTDGRVLQADAVSICTGFDVFDARIKEEYGYGIYHNVFTTVDIERMLNDGRVTTYQGTPPRRIAFLHCVGSRDEKVGQRHCSKVCCITGVKQAMELKELFPQSEVYNFYMDIRMFGPGYEELYREAQLKHNITFVRGRISEASQTIDDRIQIKAEDTLVGRPLKMTVDMLILIVGMRGGASNARFARTPGVEIGANGFLSPRDQFTGNVCSGMESIFYAGSATAPKNIAECLNDGAAASGLITRYLQKQ